MTDSNPKFGTRPVTTAVQPCPCDPATPSIYWIAFELLGEDGTPVPWEAYRVEMPDGSVATGYLDRCGRARIENISISGDCLISFPALDEKAWDRMMAPEGNHT